MSCPLIVATTSGDLENNASLLSNKLDKIKANNANAITKINTTVFCLILFKIAIFCDKFCEI